MAGTYTTKTGDQWDAIAKEVYGDELHADWLMQNNLTKAGIFEFSAGFVLQTPDLPEAQDGTLPPWR